MRLLAARRAYGKPSPRRHLKSQQIQGLTISDLRIPKSFDKCMAMRYAALLETRAEDPDVSTKRAALYVRVSTDAQTVENQIRELRQVAGRRGWDVVEVYSDAGISGAKGRNGRPGLNSMLKDASRRKFDIVMAWAIDRLGRSLIDLLDTIQHLEACGVDLYLDQQAIDTTTPMGKLVFQVTGAFAEFERTMIRQRIKAGLKRAVAQGVKLGRPKIDSATERKVRKQLAKGVGILKVAKSLGIGTGTVQRIANERTMSPRGAEQ